MPRPKTQSDPLTIRLPVDLFEILERNADKYARTPREHLRCVIEEALRAQQQREATAATPTTKGKT